MKRVEDRRNLNDEDTEFLGGNINQKMQKDKGSGQSTLSPQGSYVLQ